MLWSLLRLEPFASLHVVLQDGKFDRPDRQFRSVGGAWRAMQGGTSVADVKELIPEFFYLPDFLRNANGFDLGECQDGTPLGDVELPPWARGSPEEFVRVHAAALESEHVSRRLHQWVDLVFGCRQRGPWLRGGSAAAVERCNTFFHLTYEGSVDCGRLAALGRPDLLRTVRSMVSEYGQTPPQLFEHAHPRRAPLADIVWPHGHNVA